MQANQVGTWIVNVLLSLNTSPGFPTLWKNIAMKRPEDWDGLNKRNKQEALACPGWNWGNNFVAAREAKEDDSG
jgi:hypothetical protein